MLFAGTSDQEWDSQNYTVIDFETTGLLPEKPGDPIPGITEISLVDVRDGEIADQWTTLIDPEMSIPKEASNISKITDTMVRDAPTFPDIYDKLNEMTKGKNVVAFNLEFDAGVWRQNCERYGLEAPVRAGLCAKALASWYTDYDGVSQGHRLTNRLEEFGIEPSVEQSDSKRDGAHTAAWDAAGTAELTKHILTEGRKKKGGKHMSGIVRGHNKFVKRNPRGWDKNFWGRRNQKRNQKLRYRRNNPDPKAVKQREDWFQYFDYGNCYPPANNSLVSQAYGAPNLHHHFHRLWEEARRDKTRQCGAQTRSGKKCQHRVQEGRRMCAAGHKTRIPT